MMTQDLFAAEPSQNRLPYDGDVEDFGLIFSAEQAQQFFNYLLIHLAWQNDQAHLYGKHYTTARKVVWFGDQRYHYVYSGVERQATAWDRMVLMLKQHVEHSLDLKFNSCLANLYETGHQAIGWHSDNDRSLGLHGTIASLSFGATRTFVFRHVQSREKVAFLLHSGQLIVMRGATQQYWQHRILPDSKIIAPRINLTFRAFVD